MINIYCLNAGFAAEDLLCFPTTSQVSFKTFFIFKIAYYFFCQKNKLETLTSIVFKTLNTM